jgi:endonuclease III
MQTLAAKIQQVADLLEQTWGVPSRANPPAPLDNLMLTLLSQNTNDRNRDAAYHALRRRFPTWDAVMQADVSEIAAAIRSAGLAYQKSQRMQDILRWIHAQYGRLNLDFLCEMEPQEVMDTFCQLKGIGVKTMSVVLLFSCGVDIFPVDTHVHRLCNRIGLVRPPTKSAEQTFYRLQGCVPPGRAFALHLNLITHGRATCKARQPLCPRCPLTDLCDDYQQRERS